MPGSADGSFSSGRIVFSCAEYLIRPLATSITFRILANSAGIGYLSSKTNDHKPFKEYERSVMNHELGDGRRRNS